jgi:hypothetical protein
MNEIKELGEDQWKWLNKFESINLNHWRYIIHGRSPQWLYVGEWKPGICTPYNEFGKGGADGGYSERKKNLMSNRYYYWPD